MIIAASHGTKGRAKCSALRLSTHVHACGAERQSYFKCAGTVVGTGNRLTSFNGVTATYDADGFMKTRVTATTTDSLWWDDFGRLTTFKRVPQGGSAVTTTFAYDGFGRRIRKTVAASTVEYLWDGDQIVAELTGSGSVQKIYTYYPGIDRPRSVTSGGQTYFFSTESDGTVNGVIRKSDRAVVAQYAYTLGASSRRRRSRSTA